MNKKIFTLLAGVLLGLIAVTSVNAQISSGKQELRVKPYDEVNPLKFKTGANQGFFVLQVDSMTVKRASGWAGKSLKAKTAANSIPIDTFGLIRRGYTLYMGPDSAGQHALWVDIMGHMSNSQPKDTGFVDVKNGRKITYGARTGISIAKESAAGLWCVNVNAYNQGQNPTFDFVNKLQEQLLEVNVYGHEAWSKDVVDGWRMSNYGDVGVSDLQTPGSIASWEFSETYTTGVQSGRPLVAYLDETRDTVAVLVTTDTADINGYVQIKIAPATDVKAGKINGMLFFTLKESMPFALDKKSFESVLGTQSSDAARSLKFSPNGTPNPFTDKKWEVQYLKTVTGPKMRVDTLDHGGWRSNYRAWDVKPVHTWDTVSFTQLDSMGYVALKSGGKYLYVDTTYYNSGNTQFLRFKEGSLPKAKSAGGDMKDSIMVGQYAWRMVYYPSGDSIYINPFSATYVPTYDQRAITDSTRYATDSVVRSWYTYTAYPRPKLMEDSLYNYGKTKAWRSVPPENLYTARLRHGIDTSRVIGYKNPGEGAPTDYRYYHRLYVSLQDLVVGGKPGTRVTLQNGSFTSGTINTHINFGCYAPCNLVNSNRASIEPDLYLIRNEKGQYLHVPLYSAHDSAVWVYLDEHVHPEVLPSFQWIVEKRYKNSEASPINIINREFGYKLSKDNLAGNAKKGEYGLAFMDIQMMKDQHAPFKPRVKNWSWNRAKVNSDVVSFNDAKGNMRAQNAATFIRLPKEYKNNPRLGYQWINPDTALVNLYAFNYQSGIDNTKYISVGETFDMGAYPNTDTLLYTKGKDCFTIGYFRLDTVKAFDGAYKPYGYGIVSGDTVENRAIWNKNQVADLVQLKRQAYRISYENPYKYYEAKLSLSNGEQGRYSLSSKLRYDQIFGKPMFFLRDVYMSEDGKKDFALVQVLDTNSINRRGGYTPGGQFEEYLKGKLGAYLTDSVIMKNLKRAGELNPGLFVAAVDDQQLTLKYTYRGDVQTRISTFRLEKDSDPIYRRFNTEYEGKNPGDAPETVKFYASRSYPTGKNYLFENTGTFSDQKSYHTANKNYLGLVSSNTNPNAKTAIYVDTAYVNRGTGHIKPQYMLMVRPTIIEDTLGCDENGELTVPLKGYRRGMYLINANDSVKADAGTPRENDYLWNTEWRRLVFTDAIHANDALYILGGVDLKALDLYTKVDAKGKTKMLDLKKLDAVADTSSAAPKNGKIRKINLNNNYHKDCVFSFRLVERQSCGQRGGDFLIESEAGNRHKEPIIRPWSGGWIKIQNGVPVLTPSDQVFDMGQAEVFNVEPTDEAPVANTPAPVVTEVKVIADNGSVTILNAAGKKVVITNVLGQTVANTVLTSDRATVAAPQGVVVVAVEGEPAVKALVK